MATPPTRVLDVTPTVGYLDTSTPKLSPTFDVLAGDKIVLQAFSENSTTTVNAPTWDGSGSWALEKSIVASGYSTAYLYTCDVTATATGRTISVGASGGQMFSFTATLVRNHGGTGNSVVANVTNGAPSVDLPCSSNSLVICGNADWNAVDGTTRTWRTVNDTPMTETWYERDPLKYSVYIGRTADSGVAGTKTLGLSAPTGQTYSILGIEILAVSTPTFGYDTASIATAYVSTGTQTLSHNASANARAAVVLIDQNASAADQVSGVTYAGVPMTRVRFNTEATEAGGVYIYWLDNIAPGTQNVAMTTTGTANKQMVVSTMNASPGALIAIAGSNSGTSASIANPSWSITGLTAGIKLEAFEVIHSGLTTMTTTPAANWTHISSTDLGSQGRGFANRSIASSGTTLVSGWTAATADDYVGASIAFYEIPVALGPNGTAAGTTTYSGTATGKKTSKGTSIGVSVYSGTSVGKEITKGVSTGSTEFLGTASGSLHKGLATGETSYVGSANGKALASGLATGTTARDGTASGKEQPLGLTSGSITYIGSASGNFIAKGNSSGYESFLGTAYGKEPAKGSATGSEVYVGSSSGVKLPDGFSSGSTVYSGISIGETRPKTGSASGATLFVGSSSGVKPLKGSALGSTVFIGSAVGKEQSRGLSSGLTVYSGSAVGSKPLRGSSTGSTSFIGSASGTRASRGNSIGSFVLTGDASGKIVSVGYASGSTDYSGVATGKTNATFNNGFASGGSTYYGTAEGKTLLKGSSLGTSMYSGTAYGKLIPKGSSFGSIIRIGNSSGLRLSFGSSTGLKLYSGMAHGKFVTSGIASPGTFVFIGSSFGRYQAKGIGIGAFVTNGSSSGHILPQGIATGDVLFIGSSSGIKDIIPWQVTDFEFVLLDRTWDGDILSRTVSGLILPREWEGSIDERSNT